MDRLRKFKVLFAKGFVGNLQYTASHLLNGVASAVFGVIYVYLWKSVTPTTGFDGYTPLLVVQYVTFNQTAVWFTQFGIRASQKIRDSVRSGAVASELLRPMDFFWYKVSMEYGSVVYRLIFGGFPVALMLFRLGYYLPRNVSTWGWTALALILGAYIAIVNHYMVGISAFWTGDTRTAYWVVTTLSLGFGGVSVPLEVLPDALCRIAKLSPFACLNYNPARVYLELSGPELVLPGIVWAFILTCMARYITAKARRRLEVQGG